MTHHLEALGWTLVHFCWQAAAIALVYRIADLSCARARSHVRYLMALGALLAMLAASIATLGYEEMRSDALPVASIHVSQDEISNVGLQLAALSIAGSSDVATKAPFQPAGIMLWLDILWFVGVVSLACRTLGGWWMIRRLRRTALIPVPEPVQRCFEHVCKCLGLKRPIDFYLSEKVASPLTVGMFRALVLLPVSAVTSLSPEQLEVVLAHELAHVRRADYLWNMVQTVVETLFFFHPAVWWIGRNLRQQRELCCDDIALKSCSDPVVYASALLRLEEERRTRLHLAMALDGHQSRFTLRQRIGRILGETPLKQYPRELAPASLVGICAVLVLFLLPMPQVFASLHPKEPSNVASLLHISSGIDAALVAPTFRVGPPEESAVAGTGGEGAATHAAAKPKAAAKAAIASGQDSVAPQKADSLAKKSADGKGDYIDQMKAAGYDVDLDKYVAMKIQGVTPEYARAMAQTGFGKPSADELVSMKVQGVQPDDVNKLHQMGITAKSYQDLVEFRIFNVTPEFIAGMKAAGFDSIPSKKLVELRIHGVTPEFAKAVKAQFPDASVQDLVQMQIFQIDGPFIASAKRHGFTPLTIDKLVKLRISGVLNDESAQ
jgi:beta-lactamase regulating signal transducer with metallopeptidase domain